MAGWMRHRFRANEEDPRPQIFPPPGPFWITGFGEGYATVVAYMRHEDNLKAYWPEATDIDSEWKDVIVFSERFAKPDWYEGGVE